MSQERFVTTPFREPRTLICPRCIQVFPAGVGYRRQLEDFQRHFEQHQRRERWVKHFAAEDDAAGFCSTHRVFDCLKEDY